MMFHEIDPKTLHGKRLFPHRGPAGCSSPPGRRERCNTMTASWGGLGVLWRKPTAAIYVRPQRYTLGVRGAV